MNNNNSNNNNAFRKGIIYITLRKAQMNGKPVRLFRDCFGKYVQVKIPEKFFGAPVDIAAPWRSWRPLATPLTSLC
jgi:hypothetical protein